MSAQIPRAYLALLTTLGDEGGSGGLDRYGRVVVGPTRSLIPGDAQAWLYLVAQGLIGGEGGQLILTEAGREVYHTVKAGLIREAV